MAKKLFHDLVTLFVVVNAIGVVPLFVAVRGMIQVGPRRGSGKAQRIVTGMAATCFQVAG